MIDTIDTSSEKKSIPKGLELMIEPTIGNHNQKSLDSWYS